ncbi:metallopeptidase [Candidatus Woesebacteria bacterium]|nr:metallopeptidase [Candidatus Woesebacteria bacterium]
MLKYLKSRRKKGRKIEWSDAPDISKRVRALVKLLKIDWIDTDQIYCFRSVDANTRAYARIWGLARIWQRVLKVKPAYIIEVISEKFDSASEPDKDKIILHELTHIPKNFSGSLVPHFRNRRNKRPSFEDKVHDLVSQYLKNKGL